MDITDLDREQFLKEDLYNTLRYLFEGAIAWDAWKQPKAAAATEDEPCRVICRHQGSLGMYTAFMEARALYEFFYAHGGDDDARAAHFATEWIPSKTDIYEKYIANRKPANKRMFHLVYRRAGHSGGSGIEGDDHLKEQVLNVAKDLRDLAYDFNAQIDNPTFRALAVDALKQALDEAQKACDYYRIKNPLR